MSRTILLLALFAGATASEAFGQATITTLASFNGADGQTPSGPLVVNGNTLYGVTSGGGPGNYGTLFSLPITGGTPSVLAGFTYGAWSTRDASPTYVTLNDNMFYGTSGTGGTLANFGSLWSVPIGGGTPNPVAGLTGDTGNGPSGLIVSGTTLYGVATYGGTGGGVVYSTPTSTGAFPPPAPTVLAAFNGSDGVQPLGALILSGNTLYGTAAGGGDAADDGVIFSEPITGGTPTVLASFDGANGSNPLGGMILAGNTLYGVTKYGGAGYGEVFSLPITGGTPTILANLNPMTTGTYFGAYPLADLVLDGGVLYGATNWQGANGRGTIYSVPITGGTPRILASFTSNDSNPVLTLSGNTIYGITATGGDYGDGSVFALQLLPGDANGDGTVDITDLSKVLTNYDKSGMTWSDGDFNGDGTVNITDLSTVLTNYDKSSGASLAAVPEPSAVVLLGIGAFALLLFRQRRRA